LKIVNTKYSIFNIQYSIFNNKSMHPVLFEVGSFKLYSWGVAFAISMLVGIVVSVKRAPRFGIKPDTILDLSVIVIIAAFAGSRLWYVISHLNMFKGRWLDIINPFQNGTIGIKGLSMTGGIVLVILGSLIFVWIRKLNFVTLGDAIAPSFLLGAGIQRLGGCFLSGCCFGRPTNSFLGLVFPPEGTAGSHFPGLPLWPTQLFASVLGFVGFALVLWLGRRHSFPGFTLWQVFAYYSIERFIVDQFRYYGSSQILGTIGPFTINVNHPVLIGLFVLSAVFWLQGWLKQYRTTQKIKAIT